MRCPRREIITRYGHNQVDSEHILLALIEQPDGIVSQIFEMLRWTPSLWLIGLMKSCARHLRRISLRGEWANFPDTTCENGRRPGKTEATRLGDEYISTEHLLLAILAERNTQLARLLESHNITHQAVTDAIHELRGGKRGRPEADNIKRLKNIRGTLPQAKDGTRPDLREIQKFYVFTILSRRTKNNPVLIGEAGVGKTA